MRHWLIVLGLLLMSLCPSRLFAQTPPNAVAGIDSIAWDHVDVDVTNAGITRFETCYDGSLVGCPSVTPAVGKFVPTAAQGIPVAGNSAYRLLIPPLPLGTHKVVVRACNAQGCGGTSVPDITFQLAIVPGVPVNVRLVKGGD